MKKVGDITPGQRRSGEGVAMRESTASKLSQMLKTLTPDGSFLFITRVARMFGYGFLSVVLVLYLVQVGLSETEIGLLLTLTLVGDTIISLWITTNADRIGRRG